jgi:hypothetical protein
MVHVNAWAGLNLLGSPDTLAEIMRIFVLVVVWAGDESRGKRDRQPLFFLSALLPMREISAALPERGDKKSAVFPPSKRS